MKSKTFAVIAAYNEEKHIKQVLEGVKKHLPPEQIIVANDGSRDGTLEIALRQDVTVLSNIINLGKGAALKTGCDYAVKKGAEIIIVIDADMQHDPDDIPRFLKEIKHTEMVFGYRKFNKNMPFILKLGNNIIKIATHILYGIDIKDSQSGYRCFTKETYKKIRWSVSDYSLESEMVANAGKHHIKFVEIPIETVYSDKYKGTTVLDGVKIVINLLLWRLKR